MTIAEITTKMIEYSKGNRHDINHFLKVYALARTIGVCEGLDETTQTTLEAAALLHDIACPLCREKYGSTNGKYQEKEGPALVRTFLRDSGLSQEIVERAAYLVGHHHTPQGIDGPDYQILIEADCLVNADENQYSRERIENALAPVFRTGTGIRMLNAMYDRMT